MDGRNIADALLRGCDLPPSMLRKIEQQGDFADVLYVRLFEATLGHIKHHDIPDAVASTCPDYFAEAWIVILQYACQPTHRSLQRLKKAIQSLDPLSGLVMRLSPLVIAGSHRRAFAGIIEDVALQNAFLKADAESVMADLRTKAGPTRLVAKRKRRGGRLRRNVR